MKIQREKEDLWDKYEESLLESSWNESNIKFSLDKSIFKVGDIESENV